MKIKLFLVSYFVMTFLLKFTDEQAISYSMRKVAYSTNQFGLDLLRATKNDKLVFCPFCISSSLVMLLMGSTGEMATSLRHALYLNGLSENEINFAYFDMMNHLGVNLPTQKPLSSVNLNFKTPTSASGAFNLDLLNKAGLLSSDSQTLLPTMPISYSNSQSNSLHYSGGLNLLDSFGQRFDSSSSNYKTPYEQSQATMMASNDNPRFQNPYDFDIVDRNKLIYPFSPLNSNENHRNNFIKFSTNQLSAHSPERFTLNSDLNTDLKTSNYLFRGRAGRAFGFGKNSFWGSKSYLNPFSFIQNSFQLAPNHPSNYHQNSIQPQSDLVIEKFGQNVNPSLTSIKLPNNFHYYNVKPMSSRPMNGGHNLTTTVSNLSNTNRKQTSPPIISTPLTTETPKSFYSTTNIQSNYNHHHTFNHPHRVHNSNNFMKEHPIGLNSSIPSLNYHTVRLGNTNVDLMNSDFGGNDISFLSNIYVQRDFVINYHYHVLLQKFYKTCIHPLDFVTHADETREHINAIVQLQTDNKISNILPERQSPSTQLLLISALYFKGELDLKLNLTKTTEPNNQQQESNILMNNDQNNGLQHNVTGGDNMPSNQKSKESLIREQESDVQREEVWMEASRTRLRYAFDPYLNCSTVEMPFKDSMITLLIMIPADADGLDTLLTKLNAQMLNDVINSLEIRRITIKLPKINVENSFRNLTTVLADLGLSDLFRPGHSQLNNISDFKWLYVSSIIHKSHLNIKESSLHNQQIITSKPRGKQENEQPDAINIELNKPFLFFIMDNVSGLIVSMGKF